MTGWRSPWLLKAPDSVRTSCRVPSENWITLSWNGVENQGWLRLFPDTNAEQTNEFLGDPPAIEFLGNAITYTPAVMQRKFSLKVTDERMALYLAVRTIANLAIPSGLTQLTPITVLDYCFPETEDIRTAYGAGVVPYSVRYGMLSDIKGNGPIIQGPTPVDQYVKGGFGFGFAESTLRLLT